MLTDGEILNRMQLYIVTLLVSSVRGMSNVLDTEIIFASYSSNVKLCGKKICGQLSTAILEVNCHGNF